MVAAHQDWLWFLHELTNLGKHRVLPVTHNGFVIQIGGPLGQGAGLYIAGPFVDGQDVPMPDFPLQALAESPAQLQVASALCVTVEKGTFSRLVPLFPLNDLRTMYQYIRDEVYQPLEGNFR